jgi:ABC-type sugar transport system ATPase subunit
LPARARAFSGAATLGVRPEHLSFKADGPFMAKIETLEVLGAESIIHARLESGVALTISLRGIIGARPGDTIRLGFDDRFAHLFDTDGLALEPVRSWRDDYIVSAVPIA